MPDADGRPIIRDAIEVFEARKRAVGLNAGVTLDKLAENVQRLASHAALVIAGLGIDTTDLGTTQAELMPALALCIPVYGPVGAVASAWADGIIIGVIYAELLANYDRKDPTDA